MVTALLGKNVKELQPIFPKLFKKQTTSKKFERIVTSAPFGDVPQKPEGEEYATDLIQQANTKDVTPLEWGLMFEVTEDRRGRRSVRRARQEVEVPGLLDAPGAGQAGGAGLRQRLLDADHRRRRRAVLDRAHAEARRHGEEPPVLGGGPLDHVTGAGVHRPGHRHEARIGPDRDAGEGLLPGRRPGEGRFNAIKIVKSVKDPDSANNAVNPLSDLDITVVVNPFLSDTDAWFLVPKDKDANGLMYLERKPITQPPPMTDARTGNRLYKLRARMVWDSVDWRNTYGSTGA
jgi:hypothetical protein